MLKVKKRQVQLLWFCPSITKLLVYDLSCLRLLEDCSLEVIMIGAKVLRYILQYKGEGFVYRMGHSPPKVGCLFKTK